MTPVTPTPLRAALENVRLDGALFFRAEFTENWAFESPLTELTQALRPGARSMILFHIVAAGRCWISTPGGEKHWASRGDVIVLPYGDDYLMGGAQPAQVVPIMTLMAGPPWEQMPVLEYGAGGDRTDIVCGHMYSEDPRFDPAMRAFPPVFVVRVPDGPAARWLASSINYALAVTTESLPAPPASTRLPELLLTEVLRIHLATGRRAWLDRGAARPRIGPGDGRSARRTAPQVDCGRTRQYCNGFPVGTRPTVPRDPGPVTDQVPHRVAHAPGRRPAPDHRPQRGGDLTAHRLRVRGGIQPSLPAQTRYFAGRLAVRATAETPSHPDVPAGDAATMKPASNPTRFISPPASIWSASTSRSPSSTRSPSSRPRRSPSAATAGDSAAFAGQDGLGRRRFRRRLGVDGLG
jgi:Cupin